jgi:16S rRNA (guanine966-N2)-methyltransferase
VKEALFSILGDRVAGASVLDLFAGTGALAFEALSRGAERAVLVEGHRPTAAALSTTAQALGLADRVTVVNAPVERAVLRLDGPYDLVFADPPYALAPPWAVFAALRARGAFAPGGLVVYEYSSRNAPGDHADFTVARTERYGEVALAFVHPHA